MVDRAGSFIARGHHKQDQRGCPGPRVGKRRSEAILAPNFSVEKPGDRPESKMAGFEDHCGLMTLDAVGTAWHRVIDDNPNASKNPPRRGGIYALTENAFLPFSR